MVGRAALPRSRDGCAEGATEISPVLTRSGYAGKTSHKIILPLLSSFGEEREKHSRGSCISWLKFNSCQFVKFVSKPRLIFLQFARKLLILGRD